tara:strand:+ start:246 stop:647 length:402 start_codon:yes stop_codon:yes gene_type:complete
MNMDITIFYSVILVTFMLILAFRVIDLRKSPVTKFFHSNDRVVDEETLHRAIRGHGNLIEYAPLFLILMLTAELNGLASTYLHISGVIFTVGRLMHGIVFSFMRPNLFLRVGGMILTFMGFIILLTLSIYSLS